MGGEINEEYGVGSPKEISQDQPHPGVAPPDEEVVHHKYYQWVVFVLFLQAACFHLPRLIWKHSEGGLMKMLVGNLTDPMMIINKGDRSDRIQFIKKYFKESMKSHGPYAMKFFFCEFLCLVNVIGQMYFTDRFLGYTFMTYGSDVFAMTFGDPEGRSDPMNMVFPKVTKCTFHKYGPSGTVTRHDGLCILALNIINEKIYVFLWFWFVGVAIMSGLAIIYRMVVILVPSLRVSVICARALNQVPRSTVKALITSKSGWFDQVGDYWVIYLLSKNLNHRNEGAFGRTQAGHGSRFKQLPTGLSFNGNGREGVQHVDVEKRERRKRGVKEESSRRRRHVRESEPLWRGRTCCEIFFYRRLTIKKQRMCLAAAYTVPENAFRITHPAILISFLEK